MKIIIKYLLIATAVLIFLIPYTVSVHAAKNSAKGKNTTKNTIVVQSKKTGKQTAGYKKYKRRVKKHRADKLVILNVMPKSGTAREAGFDGEYAMETTTILDSDFTLCAKATRGLIMLDNAMLKKCGGRAKGWWTAPVKTKTR